MKVFYLLVFLSLPCVLCRGNGRLEVLSDRTNNLKVHALSLLNVARKSEKEAPLWAQPRRMNFFDASGSRADFEKFTSIGKGGYGMVFTARFVDAPADVESVVIKCYPKVALDGEDSKAGSMKRELYIHGKASVDQAPAVSKCVVREFDRGCLVFEDSDQSSCVVLAKYDSDLRHLFSEQKKAGEPLSDDQIIEILSGIVVGMQSLQSLSYSDSQQGISAPCADGASCGWVHLDLKSKNILVKKDPRSSSGHSVFVHDFGLAEYVSTGSRGKSLYVPILRSDNETPLHKPALTWGYAAPEYICAPIHTLDRSDFFEKCRKHFVDIIGDTEAATYHQQPSDNGAYFSEPFYATDVYSIGVILLEIMDLDLFPKSQTREDLHKTIDFTFANIDDLQPGEVAQSRVRFLTELADSKWSELSEKRKKLVCLASLMLDTDPTRRPSYDFIMTILNPPSKLDLPEYNAFMKSCPFD
eukprot:gnl/Spiro4/29750_TR14615_c0_g2_i1.p1 gnl/Spiro4/29750_TR14615_c0_g2~~gnl/Spiro4/29750_TR14615_c0_g2_i1.p1  ORF type:complete len:484 (-),score=56.60 gnl/Spiro4/29750_TR14615_c0_g2_i1:56-1465(-)